MNLFLIGLNHKTAPVEIRELASIAPEDSPAILKEGKSKYPKLKGMVLLSTCNRTEIYLATKEETVHLETFPQLLQLPVDIPSQHLYYHQNKEAAAHLFRVIAGMNSMILGENQIVGQVKQAFSLALELGVTNTSLNKLFQFALEGNKVIRSRTAISKGAVSISYAASELCRRIFDSLTEVRALLIGAGETGELACKHLKEAGLNQWWITNRTQKRGEDLSARLGGEFVSFESFPKMLANVDLVLAATGSQVPIVTSAMIQKAVANKYSQTCLIDLSVPRNIAPEISELDEVICYNIDDLKEIISANISLREKEAKRAEIFVQEHVQKYLDWDSKHNQGFDVKEILKTLENIRTDEIEKHKKKLKIEEPQMERVNYMTQVMMKRVLNLILKQQKENKEKEESSINFDLDDELLFRNEESQ